MTQSKQDAFLTLYEPVHERFERFCRAKVYGRMECSDLINETLLVAYEKFDSLKSEKAFLAFLFGISTRILSNQHQKKKEDYIGTQDRIVELNDRNAKTHIDAEIHFLYKALDELEESQKECIILFEIAGFKIREIAEIQSVSESAVKQKLRRGRKKLMDIMTFESLEKKGEVQNG